MDVVIGIDSHKETLAAAAIDELGKVAAVREFSNSPRGHRKLQGWVRARGTNRTIGIEGSGAYGAGAARHLLAAGEDVREVPASFTHRERRKRPSQGKSDVVDAVAIARVVAREERLFSPRRDGVVEDLKLLSDHRDQLKRARNRVANRTHRHLAVAHPGYEQKVPKLTGKKHLAASEELIAGDDSVRANIIRGLIGELRRIDEETRSVEKLIHLKVQESGSALVNLHGVGDVTAAKILGEVGDPSQIRSKAAFAMLNGTAPLPASSGSTTRHRLNRGGNRQLNFAVHVIALARVRTDAETQAYLARQRAEGKTSKEAMRSLKRYVSNKVYRCLMLDARATNIAA
jgi:transposase